MKAYGNYEDFELARTDINEFLRELTGAPIIHIDLNLKFAIEQLENILQIGVSKKHILIFSHELF